MLSSYSARLQISQRVPKVTLQRWIATNTRKRRKPKSLVPRSYPETTRDRVRWLQDRNEVLNDNYYRFRAWQRKVEDLGDTAEERLYWIRNKIFSFWRDAKQQEDAAAAQGGKKRRRATRIDSKWWFWNILLALMPSILLACYCQFIAMPQMIEYDRQNHLKAQREKWGDLYVEEEDEELARLTQGAIPFTTRVYNAVKELTMYFWTQEIPEVSIPGGHQALRLKNATSSAEQEKPKPAPVHDRASPEAQTIVQLKLQLEALERRLKERDPNAIPSSTKPQQEASRSGIGQRVEKERQERERRRELARERQAAEAANESEKEPLWQRMYETSKQYYNLLLETSVSQPKEKSDEAESPALEKIARSTLQGQEKDEEATTNPLTKKTTEPVAAKPRPISSDEQLETPSSNSTDGGEPEAPRGKKNTTGSWWSGWWPKSSQ